MAQQGMINFPDLGTYVWKAANFQSFQTYLNAFQVDSMKSRNSSGVIYGCDVSVVSGLTIQITSGVILLPSGVMVSVLAQQVTLPAANVSNPRIDRIELAYQLVDNTTVVNISNQTKVFDRFINAVLFVNQGTAASSPVANGKTVGNVSIAAVNVATGAVSLVSGNIDSTADTYRDVSSVLTGTQGQAVRFNPTTGNMEVSLDGSTWNAISIEGIKPQKFSISNNQSSAASLSGMVIDKTKFVGAKFLVEITITTSSAELVEFGEIFAIYRPTMNSWDLVYKSEFDDAGVTFSITSGGQIMYISSNVAGTSYSGSIRITNSKYLAV